MGMTVLVAGDFCQDYRVDSAIRERNFNSLFQDVRNEIIEADYSIVNFEFPIVTRNSKRNPILKCGPNLQGTMDAIDAIKYAGFDCCTLANNHTLDQGESCGMETKELLESKGIDTVGFGRNSLEASKVLYKRINNKVIKHI